MTIRRFFSDSLVGRTLFVLIAGLALSQIASTIFFSWRSEDFAARLVQRQLAERIVSHMQMIEDASEDERQRILRVARRDGFFVRYSREPWAKIGIGPPEVERIRLQIKEALPDRDILVSLGPPPPGMDFPAAHGGGRMREHGAAYRMPPPLLTASVRSTGGEWVNFVAPPDFSESSASWTDVAIPLGTGFLVVLVLSVLAVRRAVLPLETLSLAAERLGRDVGAPPVPEQGTREVRRAARAFNGMQERLKRFIDDRTQMISAISHDLRTPITRMRLRAEFIEDEEARERMLADLDEMEAMIRQTLAFGRDDAAGEEREQVDLAAMLQDICGHFGARWSGPDSLILSLGPIGVKRAFTNLVENAIKYGAEADISLTKEGAGVVVLIEDRGPGIREEDRERAFRPFVRLEGSRNRDTGGTGLGLAIARSAIRAHGGDIALANRKDGGLCVRVSLPG